jgi:bacillithiol synthase
VEGRNPGRAREHDRRDPRRARFGSLKGRDVRIETIARDVLGAPPMTVAFAERRPRGFVLAHSIEDIPSLDDRWEADERVHLADELRRELRRLEPPVAVLDSLSALSTPGTACVVTGQQPGLLGGPLYSLYKALHAVRLARSLSQRWERPVVPLFWNHGDDHDVAEVHHAWLVNENLDLQRLALAGMSSGRMPVSRIRFGPDHKLPALIETLRQALARTPHVEDALEVFAPREGETFATAFTRTMTRLLGHLGLVVVEPDWIRARMSRELQRIVRVPLEPALAAGESEVRASGLEPAIAWKEAALVYRLDARGRNALRLGGDGYRYDGEDGSRTPGELAAEIVQSPHDWSPGALLRPLVQDAVFPSVAYVGGWGELGYLAQLGPAREAAGVAVTAAVPRWSATLVDRETDEALAQLGTSVEAVLRSRGAGLASGDDEAAPQVVHELREIAARTAKELAARREALAELDRGLAANLPRTADQIRSLVEKLCEKAERVDANRRGRGKRLIRRVTNAVVPRGEPQERVLGALPYVARYGREWIDELFDSFGTTAAGHLVAHLEDSTGGTG